MKIRLLLFALLFTGLAACDRTSRPEDPEAERQRDSQRQADEARVAELRDLEQRAAQREVDARAAANERESGQLSAEGAQIERERQKLAEAQSRAENKRFAELREQQRSADQQATEKAAAQRETHAERTLDFFYAALQPHGDWIEVEKYGYCWQPRVAEQRGWRPYVDGNWVWTDYGWTWASKEPFGWAVYHYGRWAHLRRLGWVWVPSSEWAPAWVAWRSSDRYVGWAPLPPEAKFDTGFTSAVDSRYDIGPEFYNFVTVENFGEPTYMGCVVEPKQNVTVINNTVNVTNVTYRTVENKTVVYNDGPALDRISARTKIRQLKVERLADEQHAGPAEQRGNALRMLAPIVAKAARPDDAPQRIKERVKAAEVERGWSGVAPAEAEQVRAQQTREARRAEQPGNATRGANSPAPTSAARSTPPARPGFPAPRESARPLAATPAPRSIISPTPAATPATSATPRERERPLRPERSNPSASSPTKPNASATPVSEPPRREPLLMPVPAPDVPPATPKPARTPRSTSEPAAEATPDPAPPAERPLRMPRSTPAPDLPATPEERATPMPRRTPPPEPTATPEERPAATPPTIPEPEPAIAAPPETPARPRRSTQASDANANNSNDASAPTPARARRRPASAASPFVHDSDPPTPKTRHED